MRALLPLVLLALFTIKIASGTPVEPANSAVNQNEKTSRARSLNSISTLLDCASKFDAVCVLDTSEDILKEKSRALWDEVYGGARAEKPAESETPTELVESISKIISEITDLFKSGLEGLFKEAKESEINVKATNGTETADSEEDDDEEEEEESEETTKESETKSRQLTEEGRGKKKKKKKALMKLLMLGLILKAKLGLLLKVFAAHLQIKFLAIAAAGLFINAIRLYFDLKKGHTPQKVIYYEHAQHQHHYDGGDEDWTSPGGHWGRSYTLDNDSAQEKAYVAQKPIGIVYSSVNNKPNYSFQ